LAEVNSRHSAFKLQKGLIRSLFIRRAVAENVAKIVAKSGVFQLLKILITNRKIARARALILQKNIKLDNRIRIVFYRVLLVSALSRHEDDKK